MKFAVAAVVLAACAADPKPAPVVPPDTQELQQLYPSAQQRQVTVPFAVDLGDCALIASSVTTTNQFALTHVNDAGQCEVWLGYKTIDIGLMHADQYCAFEPYGTATVKSAPLQESGDGACGGPPGTPPLAIDTAHCVKFAYN